MDENNEGTYSVTYTAIDNAGNQASATRTVIVKSSDVIWNVSNVSEFRQALENAAANGVSDTIVLAKGTYNTTSDNLGTFKFNDNEEFNLTIRSSDGLTHQDVILDGNGIEIILNLKNSSNGNIGLKGLTLTNSTGYAIYSYQNITINDCNISYNNQAIHSLGTTTINKSDISFNIYRDRYDNTYEAIFSKNSISINDSNISYNKGGAVSCESSLNISNSTLSFNTGGNLEYTVFCTSNSSIKDSNIIDNNSSGLISFGGSVNLINSNIVNNDGNGFQAYEGSAYVLNSNISNNNGIGFISDYYVTLINSIVSYNKEGIFTSYYNYSNYDSSLHASEYSYIVNNTFVSNRGMIIGRGAFINNIFISEKYYTIKLWQDNPNSSNDDRDSNLYNNCQVSPRCTIPFKAIA